MFSQAIRRWFAPARPSRPLRRPRFEELESRLTPAIANYFTDTHQLQIYGTDQADTISLSADSEGKIVISDAGTPVVVTDGATGQEVTPTVADTQSIYAALYEANDRFNFYSDRFRGGTAVSVFGDAGVDYVAFHAGNRELSEPSQVESPPLSFAVDGWNGIDTFEAFTNDYSQRISLKGSLPSMELPRNDLQFYDLETNAFLYDISTENTETIVLNTGKAADIVEAQVDWGADGFPSDPSTPFAYRFNLSEGSDALDFHFRSEANLRLNFYVNAGQGEDAIAASFSWLSISSYLPAVNTTFELGTDDDRLEMIYDSEAAYVPLIVQADAGGGHDDIAASFSWLSISSYLPVFATIDLQGGNDKLELDLAAEDASVGMGLFVTGGEGADEFVGSFSWLASQPLQFSPLLNTRVDLGAQDDTFELSVNAPDILGAIYVDLDTGFGADDVSIRDCALGGVGNFAIKTGLHDDLLLFERNSFGRGLNMNYQAGPGYDTVLFQDCKVQGPANLAFNLSVGGDSFTFANSSFTQGLNFFLNTGAGPDWVSFRGISVTGAARLNFNTETSDDYLAIRGCNFQETTLNVRGGPGRDRVIFEDNVVAGPGKLNFHLGPGRNTFFARRNRLGKQVILKAEPPPSP
jgi:hypothetical protein